MRTRDQAQLAIETAGSNISGIEIESRRISKELDSLRIKITEKANWNEQISGMNHAMAVINGGALEHDEFISGLVTLHSGVISALKSPRLTVARTACIFIAQLARELGQQFDSIGDYLTHIVALLDVPEISEYCKYLILFIVKKCHSRKILASVIEICGMRRLNRRLIGAESLSIVTSTWNAKSIGTNWSRMFHTMTRMMGDESQDVVKHIKQAIKDLDKLSPQKAREFRSTKSLKSENRSGNSFSRSKYQARRAITIPFVKGQEKGFSNQVRDAIETGKGRDLCFAEILPNLMMCCWHESATVVIVALTALHDIITLRPDELADELEHILELMMHHVSGSSPRCASKANMILQELQSVFDVSLIESVCLSIEPSPKLLNYALSLNTNSDEFLLRIAFHCLDDTNQKAIDIIEMAAESQPEMFQNFVDGLDPERLREYQMLLPNVTMRQVQLVDIPAIDEANEAELMGIVESDAWTVMRPQVFLQIDKSMMMDNSFAVTLAQRILRLRGFEDFHLLMHGIVYSVTGPSSRIAESLLETMCHSVDNGDILSALQACLCHKNTRLVANAVGFEAKLISRMSKRDLKPRVEEVTSNLNTLVQHKMQSIRKSAVSCLVELRSQFGHSIDSYIENFDETTRNAASVGLSMRYGIIDRRRTNKISF